MLQMFAAGAAMLMIAANQTPQQPGAAADPQPNTPVVLTGCVIAATQEAATQGKETQFMLINASPAPAGGDETRTGAPEPGTTGVGTTGTGTSGTGSSASSTTAQDTAQLNVLLTTDGKLSLRRHVNHRVEVQGTMDRTAEAPKADEPREVRVTKVRRLSSPCSGKK
jgi:hypothetical protein